LARQTCLPLLRAIVVAVPATETASRYRRRVSSVTSKLHPKPACPTVSCRRNRIVLSRARGTGLRNLHYRHRQLQFRLSRPEGRCLGGAVWPFSETRPESPPLPLAPAMLLTLPAAPPKPPPASTIWEAEAITRLANATPEASAANLCGPAGARPRGGR
jgi:hypothetical protein